MSSSSQKIVMVTVGSTVSLSILATSSHAQATGTAADLLPLESPNINVHPLPNQLKALQTVSTWGKPEAHYSPDLLQSVAHNINSANQPDVENTPDISDLIDLSFIEQFIDEDGNVDLPLGITVYEAMGTTSIGFGGDF